VGEIMGSKRRRARKKFKGRQGGVVTREKLKRVCPARLNYGGGREKSTLL